MAFGYSVESGGAEAADDEVCDEPVPVDGELEDEQAATRTETATTARPLGST
jgi:hypothetical protein